nr:retrovirus-related Pol polyprotein from transposon TNT 1-94 [Tanacetum cinerariifolium]
MQIQQRDLNRIDEEQIQADGCIRLQIRERGSNRALSTAEAEYVSLSACCTQVIWMRTQLTDYGFHFNKIPIYCDSKSAIAISCNPVQYSRTKHIAIHYHFIKEHVEKGTTALYFVKTDYQLADLFTKSLLVDRFNYLVRRLEADLSKDTLGLEPSLELRRSWCVKGNLGDEGPSSEGTKLNSTFITAEDRVKEEALSITLTRANICIGNSTNVTDSKEKLQKQNFSANHEGKHKSINGKRPQQAEKVRLKTIAGMIRGNTSRKRPREQSEQWLDNEISFPSTQGCQLVDSPIILEALIEGFLVRRIYADEGSSSKVMMEEAQGLAMEGRVTLPHIQAAGSVGTTSQGKKEEHELKTYPHIELRVQRTQSIAPDKRKVVKDEVAEWLKAGIVRKGIELEAYGIKYAPRSVIKGQVLVDFLADTMAEDNSTQIKSGGPNDTLIEGKSRKEFKNSSKNKGRKNACICRFEVGSKLGRIQKNLLDKVLQLHYRSRYQSVSQQTTWTSTLSNGVFLGRSLRFWMDHGKNIPNLNRLIPP